MYKKLKKFLYTAALFFVPLSFSSAANFAKKGKDIWIIVHGTFAKNARWHKAEGEFFKSLQAATKTFIYSFSWSGKLSAVERREAGISLKNFICNIAQPEDQINIVAHSHGGNVSIIAATYLSLEKSPIYIDKLILLATPIPIKLNNPDMLRIKKIYNFFSYGDQIQPLLNRFKRVFGNHPQIFNIQLRIKNKSPLHQDMHDPLIAHFLPHVSTLVNCHTEQSLVMHITSKDAIHIEHDTTREQDLRTDNAFIKTVFEVFADPYRHYKVKPHNISSEN